MHRHRTKTSRDVCYTGQVGEPQNRAAHGNITRVDTCSCGATRFTNINGLHVERGPWLVPHKYSVRCDCDDCYAGNLQRLGALG